MSAFSFSSTFTMRFSLSCCCCFLLVSSSVFGFTTTTISTLIPVGAKTNHNHNRNRYGSRKPSLRSNSNGNAASAISKTTALHLSFSSELPVMSEMISTYTHCLKYHYYPTQSITNAVLTVVGDGIAQAHEEHRKQSRIDANENDNRLDNDDIASTNIHNTQGTRHFYDPKRGLVYFFKGLGSGIMWAWWFDRAEVWSMEWTQSVLSLGHSQEALDFTTSATTTTSTTDALSVLVSAQSIRTVLNIVSEQFLVCPILFSVWDIPVTSLMRGTRVEQVPLQIREKLLPLLVANAKVWTLVNVVTYNIPLEYRLLFTSAASIVSESINAGITSQQIVPPQQTVVATSNELQGQSSLPSQAAATPLISTSTNPIAFAAVGGMNGKNITAVFEVS